MPQSSNNNNSTVSHDNLCWKRWIISMTFFLISPMTLRNILYIIFEENEYTGINSHR
jgi:hypothetical protein